MPRDLYTPDDLQALIDRGAQLVEVLPSEEFDEEHIPGAVSIPLGEVTAEGTAGLDPDRPVVMYCYDYQ